MVTRWRPSVRPRGLWMPGIWWVLCSLHARDRNNFYAALFFCDGFEHFEDITIRVQVWIIYCNILQRSRTRHIASSHNRHDMHATHTHFICNHCIHILYICMHATQTMYALSFIYPARIGIPCHLLHVEGMPRLYPHYWGRSWCCFPCGCSWVSLELQNS